MDEPDSISDLDELIGKTVLVAITRVDHTGELLSQDQFHGVVVSLDEELVHIRVAGTGEDFTLPPDPRAFFYAAPGEYTLRATGEMVTDPDITTTWTVTAPGPSEAGSDDA
jgi:hypothetical protein